MARTDIDIDEHACAAVMRRFGLATKQDAVNYALRELASTDDLVQARALRGSGWEGDLAEFRDGRRR